MDESLWLHYRREWGKIRERWPLPTDGGDWEAVAMMREAERAELVGCVREALRAGFSGPYPVLA